MKQDDIDSIIEACIRYPSGDNLQPWRFKKNNDNKVEIFRIATDHYLQEKNYFARLEFGCLKTYLAISAKQYGYNLSYEMFSENFSIKNKQVIWAIVHFEATSDKGHHLFHFLDKRVTDRRSYLKSDSNYINEDQQIKIISNDDKKLLKAISKVESLGWSNDYYSKDILQYCNLSRSENEKETGMAWRSLGISLPERLLLYSLKTIPWLSKLVRSTFFPFFYAINIQKLLQKSEGFFSVGATDNTDESIIKCGETATNVWLDLMSHGYHCQPLSISSFFTSLNLSQIDKREKSKAWSKSMEELQSIYVEKEIIPNKKSIHWIFRFGRPQKNFPGKTLRQKYKSAIIN